MAFTRTGYPPPLRYCHAARVSQLMELHMSALPPKEAAAHRAYYQHRVPLQTYEAPSGILAGPMPEGRELAAYVATWCLSVYLPF